LNKNGFEGNNHVKYLIIVIVQCTHIFTNSLQNIHLLQQLRKKMLIITKYVTVIIKHINFKFVIIYKEWSNNVTISQLFGQ
jgi:hypothetical protein